MNVMMKLYVNDIIQVELKSHFLIDMNNNTRENCSE